jgi:hypothetical protein
VEEGGGFAGEEVGLDLRRGRTPCLRIEAERERRRTRVEVRVDQTRSSAVPTPAVASLLRGPPRRRTPRGSDITAEAAR